MQSRNKAEAGARLRQSRAGAKAGQEHGRSGQEQCKSRITHSLSFASISPHAIFCGQKQSRSRAGAGSDQGRKRVGAEQEQGRSKAGARAGQEQEPNYSSNTKFHPCFA